MAAVKLAGFLVLLAVIVVCAHALGAGVGPMTTEHSKIQYAGTSGGSSGGSSGGTNMGGMNMGGQP